MFLNLSRISFEQCLLNCSETEYCFTAAGFRRPHFCLPVIINPQLEIHDALSPYCDSHESTDWKLWAIFGLLAIIFVISLVNMFKVNNFSLILMLFRLQIVFSRNGQRSRLQFVTLRSANLRLQLRLQDCERPKMKR